MQQNIVLYEEKKVNDDGETSNPERYTVMCTGPCDISDACPPQLEIDALLVRLRFSRFVEHVSGAGEDDPGTFRRHGDNIAEAVTDTA